MSETAEFIPIQPYYHLPSSESMSVVERVAFAMAREGHKARVRSKDEGDIAEIYHLSLTRNILERVGVDNPMTLAIAWMHDLLEDCEEYKNIPEELDRHIQSQLDDDTYNKFKLLYCKDKLRKEYTNRLINEGVDRLDAYSIGEVVAETVYLLSNHLVAPNSKREEQTDKVAMLSDRARLVKIADQLSSMVEDIHFTSLKDKEDLSRFFFKASGIISDCSGVHPLLDRVAVETIRERHTQLVMDSPHSADRISKTFNLDEIIKDSRKEFSSNLRFDSYDFLKERKGWLEVPNKSTKKWGITSIHINPDGLVDGYRILSYGAALSALSNPELENNEEIGIAEKRTVIAKQLQTILDEQAPRSAHGSQVNVRYRTLDGGRFCRTYMLGAPVEVKTFLEYCFETGALEKEQSRSLLVALKRQPKPLPITATWGDGEPAKIIAQYRG